MEIVLPRRYRGPLTSANGGYACGRLAAFVDAEEVEVTLRLPLRSIARSRSSTRTAGRSSSTATHSSPRRGRRRSRSSRRRRCPSTPPTRRASDTPASWSPDFGECYVCGVREDGLEIRVGPVAGREPLHAAPVALRETGAEFVWAAVDCPGAYAVGAEGRGDIVLGRMTARVDRVPEAGDELVVASWPLGEDGRKLYAGTALFAPDGELLALARQTWIAPKSS